MCSLVFRLQQGTGWCVDLSLNMSETALWKHYTAEPIRTHTLGDVNEFVSVLDGVESSLQDHWSHDRDLGSSGDPDWG